MVITLVRVHIGGRELALIMVIATPVQAPFGERGQTQILFVTSALALVEGGMSALMMVVTPAFILLEGTAMATVLGLIGGTATAPALDLIGGTTTAPAPNLTGGMVMTSALVLPPREMPVNTALVLFRLMMVGSTALVPAKGVVLRSALLFTGGIV